LSTVTVAQPIKTNWIPFATAGATALAGYTYYQTSNKLSAESKAALIGDDQWVDIKVKEVITINHNVKRVIFELPSSEHVLGLSTASCVLTKFIRPENGKAVIRPYTPVSDPAQTGEFELIIKSYQKGLMSNHIHGLNPGEVLSFKGPIVKYRWEPNLHKEIALLGGGTGITPLYQLIHAIDSNPNDKTKVHLFFANIGEEDILLKSELEQIFKKKPDQFKLHLFLEKAPNNWDGGVGYITKEYLSKELFPASADNVKVFVCGPPPFYEAISGNKVSPTDQGELKGHLKDLGFTKDQVFKF
jgi:cytochrome-b5 reductase